jgi:hypothetical protein
MLPVSVRWKHPSQCTGFCELFILFLLVAVKLPVSFNSLRASFDYLLFVPGHQTFSIENQWANLGTSFRT